MPNFLKLTAHGYKKITSTSNRTNKIAVMKYFTEKGFLALPMLSRPHSKDASCLFPLALGPNKWVPTNTSTTKPRATRNCMIIGK